MYAEFADACSAIQTTCVTAHMTQKRGPGEDEQGELYEGVAEKPDDRDQEPDVDGKMDGQ